MDSKQRAEAAFTDVEEELKSISRWMYEHPEMAYEEHESSRRLATFLGDHGFAVELPTYGLNTAFAARVGTTGPEVIICAEYDALPTVGHACGHNLIATAALGAGVALAAMADELECRVTVLGTPAEEKIGGKVDLINAGAFTGAAASMMIHPSPKDAVDQLFLAVAHLEVEFKGKDAHAAASPWEGRNALDAFVSLYNSVSSFRQQMRATDKIHGIITKGGDAPNIIPSYTHSEWYVRADTAERLDELSSRFADMVAAAATATGCTFELKPEGHTYTDIIPDPLMVDLYAANSAALGRPLARAADLAGGAAGSTDMGNVSHVVPAIHPMLGMETDGAVNHQPEFAAHTITADGEKVIRDGALAMAWTIIDIAEGNRWSDLRKI